MVNFDKVKVIRKDKDGLKLEFQTLNNFEEKELVETHSQFHCTLYKNSNNSFSSKLLSV